MIITIDGPAGSGKTTAARRLADRLSIPYLDTGAMYRAIGLAVCNQRIPLDDASAVANAAQHATLTCRFGGPTMRICLDGVDVTDQIRTMAVTQAGSRVAQLPEIRHLLVTRQKQIGRELGSLVTEGRDQGSDVFPDADLRVLLDCDVEIRTQRRHAELTQAGQNVSQADVRNDITRRDLADAKRWAPLLTDATVRRLNTTDMTIDEVIDALEALVRDVEEARTT